MDYLRGGFGIVVLLGLALLFSRDRKAINWRLVAVGMALQLLIGILIIHVDFVKEIVEALSDAFVVFLGFAEEGAVFVFGDLGLNSQANEGANHNLGLIFAFQVLPIIIFFSSVSAALYYLGVLQKMVWGFAWVMSRTMRLSGSESLAAAGNVFLGQAEAPLLVKPFIPKMTHSELMTLMTGGMATIAGSVMAAYISFLGGNDPQEQSKFASYLLTASVMSAPAAIVFAKMLLPEEKGYTPDTSVKVSDENIGTNFIDALSNGASDGLKMALNIGAMLIAFISVIALVNYLLEHLGAWLELNQLIAHSTDGAFQGLSLQYIFGLVFRLLAWSIGVSWEDSLIVGSLLGTKTAVNEFVAYKELGQFKQEGLLSRDSVVIATYALCGFANFSSIAIQIGGIGGMAPSQKTNISRLGLLSLVGGTLACLSTGTIAGMLIK